MIIQLKWQNILPGQFKKVVLPRTVFNRFCSKGNWSTKDFFCGLNLEPYCGLKTSKMHPVCAAPNLIRLKYPVQSGIKSLEKCSWPSRIGYFFDFGYTVYIGFYD